MGFFPGSVRDLTNSSPIDVSFVDTSGNQITTLSGNPPANGALTTIAAPTTADQVGLPSNPNRKKFIIWNSNNQSLRVGLGFATSATAFSFLIAKSTPFVSSMNDFTGDVHISLTSSGTGSILITELT